MSAVEIICSKCGQEALIQREAIYDGFTKTGERLSCSHCGHEYTSEAEVPYKTKRSEPRIFTDADRSKKVEVFNANENERLCRYCANYLINPFTQFCSLHRKEVQATDTCPDFCKKNGEDKSNLTL